MGRRIKSDLHTHQRKKKAQMKKDARREKIRERQLSGVEATVLLKLEELLSGEKDFEVSEDYILYGRNRFDYVVQNIGKITIFGYGRRFSVFVDCGDFIDILRGELDKSMYSEKRY